VGGYVQNSIIFKVDVIKDPCSYYPYVTHAVEDLTLWINSTEPSGLVIPQVALIPPFTMSDPSWVCNFTYEIRNGLGGVLDGIFVLNEVAKQGDGPNFTLVTTNSAKTELSPQTIRVRGWPKRQNTTSASIFFRVFVAFFDKTDCPSIKYFSPTLDTCVPCVSPCKTCYNETACKWCLPGYTYVASTLKCLQNPTTPGAPPVACPAGTIMDPNGMNFCRSCPDFCLTCTSLT
jgi:hypothetical protein